MAGEATPAAPAVAEQTATPAATPEAAKPAETPAPAASPDAARIAILSRQQAQARAAQDAAKAALEETSRARAAWQKEQETAAVALKEYEAWKAAKGRVKDDPLSALALLGIQEGDSLRDFITRANKAVLNGGLVDPMAPVRMAEERADAKVAALRKEIEDRDTAAAKKAEEAEAARLQQEEKEIIEREQTAARDFLTANAAKYPLTEAAGASDMIHETRLLKYQEDVQAAVSAGDDPKAVVPMTCEAAAAEVEKYWTGVRDRLAPKPAATEQQKPAAAAPAKPQTPVGLATLPPPGTAPAQRRGPITLKDRDARADEVLAKLGFR